LHQQIENFALAVDGPLQPLFPPIETTISSRCNDRSASGDVCTGSPPDAVAPLSIARRLQIPRRILVVLEGEGLASDATALALYFAVAAVSAGTFSLGEAASIFVIIVVGEIAWGIGVGWLMLRFRRWAARQTYLALHGGEVLYGNFGGRSRLEFTCGSYQPKYTSVSTSLPCRAVRISVLRNPLSPRQRPS
jgi:hypothetical protein